ncbi:FecR family protein [Sphingobacterium nematocida]|uniref:FecR family protein n=1 Tax=Sphingobacterium nematocida TaxID=1513896 RepID=A0A1T5EZ23_9SPHI|nr:FecR domain-containing protein [Sphingobacterium nematocida]SKB89109.1 FecR family protein [Sphingobacterium nematocida]
MDKNRLQLLFNKYLNGTLDTSEEEEFDAMMATLENSEFSNLVDESIELRENVDFEQESVYQNIAAKMEEEDKPAAIRSLYAKWKQLGKIAAVLLLTGLLGIVTYRMWNGESTEGNLVTALSLEQAKDMELPKEDALITLADGKQLSLADVGKDTLHYKGLTLLRDGNGTIVMGQDEAADFFNANEKHRFVAPKGVMLRLMLPDASIVNLNSDSQIEIAGTFGKRQREVALEGEAFFDVAHNKALPFVVHAKNATVTVLGTQFNMSAYKTDKVVATTLLSGSVRVGAANREIHIKPGQQAQVNLSATIELKNKVNMSDVLAWKEGYFRFRDAPIRNIMADLAKWYPIEGVEFKAGSTDRFTGSIQRSKKLSDVLASIEQVSDLRFDIQEGRVVVMK